MKTNFYLRLKQGLLQILSTYFLKTILFTGFLFLNIVITTAQSIQTLPPSSSYLCVVSAVSVPFTATGVFNEGNVFTAQLSDGSGSFANPTDIGTLTSTKDTGTIQAITMGANAFYYNAQHYRIRVVSSNPAVTGSDNGSDVKFYETQGGTRVANFLDADGDGYGDPNTYLSACSQLPGYILDGSDCNDSDATINPMTVWVLDADADGYYAGNPIPQCSSPGIGYMIKTTQMPGDCDDNNAKFHSPQTYYADKDKDGYGDPNSSAFFCGVPPLGYVADGTDCNDSNASVHSPQTYFVDNDKDGYGSTTTAKFCSSIAPVGYSTNNTDCNDSNASINPSTVWVIDADRDGYYSGNPVMQCTSPGTSYVIKTTQVAGDCNDNDAGVHVSIPYYVDADKDGYGAGAAVLFCSSKAPAGYSVNNLDCNDKCTTIHPGLTDGFDGIDNDCDGQIDEDFFQLSVCDAGIYEGNSGQCYLYFTVSLNWIDCRTVTVNYTTQNGTATAGSDYVAKSGTLTFLPGILLQTIAIQINGDKTVEPNENFQVVLSNPYNATLYKGTGTGTIYNDDGSIFSSFLAGGLNATKMNETSATSVRLSPVPARTELHVSLTGFEGKILLQVAGSEGKLVISKQSTSAQMQQTINVSKLAAGNYILMVSDEKGNRKTEKFVVSR